jgi:hypothetical protein
MPNFFILIYIKPNRLSDEQICVGVLANINEVPFFYSSNTKLNFALNYVGADMRKSIKRSFRLLDDDVEYVKAGAVSLFDKPYTKKLLDKLSLKKRGVIQFTDVFESDKDLDFDKLVGKYVGE